MKGDRHGEERAGRAVSRLGRGGVTYDGACHSGWPSVSHPPLQKICRVSLAHAVLCKTGGGGVALYPSVIEDTTGGS